RRGDGERHLRAHRLDRPGVQLDLNDVRKNEDVVISGKAATSLNNGSTTPSFDAALLDKVKKLPDVAQADGSVTSDQALLIDKKGKAIVFGGAPNLGFSIDDPSSPFNV